MSGSRIRSQSVGLPRIPKIEQGTDVDTYGIKTASWSPMFDHCVHHWTSRPGKMVCPVEACYRGSQVVRFGTGKTWYRLWSG